MSNKRLDLVRFEVGEFQRSNPADDHHETERPRTLAIASMVDRLTTRSTIGRVVGWSSLLFVDVGRSDTPLVTARRSVQDDHHFPARFTGFHDAMSFPDVAE
jgi:hypothetical protein